MPGQSDQREASGSLGTRLLRRWWWWWCAVSTAEWQAQAGTQAAEGALVWSRAGASGRGGSDGPGRQGVGSRGSALVLCYAVCCAQ
ncbi:uncharacterized protein CC84DRAFT_862525 [Paraphaeosphaeria sporulosa]|uniref:Uncharacterized protein n=1 Tax=Paraphaeosphaeria sporulosa TaxID=1460663 RepID=A0A177C7Y3_9PLEO|nr:uncharacterized protein CC84DRAFT_862525 [Paraphaeosphaeria sporulosa]OAG03665.1 hypothetical protein CC84DRAFT_862525 [Paraphaeosphaeria sporulosa]